MGGGDYFGLIKTVAVTGVLVAAFSGLFSPGRFHGWGWLFGFLFLYHVLFLPKTEVVVVDKLGSQPPVVIGNVPLGVAFFGHFTSKVGDVMTRFFETAFQVIPAPDAQLPGELAYQKNGVMFGNRVIQASRSVNVADPQLRTDLIAFVYNCTLYDLQDGTIDPAVFAQSTDIWALMGNPNPARFSTFGNPVTVDTCPKVYAYLANRLPAEVARARSILAFQLNPSLDPASAQGVIDSQLEQAYYKTRIATAAQSAADLLRQNIMLNLVQDTSSIAGQKINDPASLMIATARANATASINSSFLTMGKVAEQALPLIRNVIEAIIYAVFPFVFLLFLLAHGRGLGLAIKSFVLSLVWIQLWPPLYAILNYVATLASARTLEAAARMGGGVQGLALETASGIYRGAISDQAVAGYMVISIPIIATAIIKGGEVAFQAVTGVGTIQSAVSSESSAASKGNVTQDAVSLDQQQLAPNRTSAYMATSTDAHGSTIQGSGPEAGVLRYQATLSRLATTFTFSERQAGALADTAREAETFARSERDSMQRSQTAALTQALSIQDGFERAQTRSGAAMTSEGGSTSTQLQTLGSIAREVNRRLGLSDESLVGKTVAAAASAGAKIPFTEIGGRIATEGRAVDQERLQSAYDYARKAAETTQVSDATALMNEFRSSEAYQWSHGSRTAGTESFDSAYREARERQSSSELAHTQARETGRVAQFMREWSSGAQTDFTNYAAQRLSERGLLREEDPIRLQRAVTEVAYSYARGGDVGTAFVPNDSPLEPTRSPAQLLGWPESSPGEEYGPTAIPSGLHGIRASNDEAVRDRQSLHGVRPGEHLGDDVTAPVRERAEGAAGAIENRRNAIARDQDELSADYNRNVNAGRTSPNHGGNKAVWDTVGAQSDNRAGLGSPAALSIDGPSPDKSVPD